MYISELSNKNDNCEVVIDTIVDNDEFIMKLVS